MTVPRLAIALCHYPVLDPRNQVSCSAITNLDVHDMARSATTYGVDAAYVVTPVAKQRELVEAILQHWLGGTGGDRCPDRSTAFKILHPAGSIEEVLALEAVAADGQTPTVVVTSARHDPAIVEVATLRERLQRESALILFGTARGLAPSVLERADLRLAPLEGTGSYNHLSVRAAIAIYLDRLRGR
ncbi:MAG: RNA methyltransferase [Pseudomonadota bacterium]